MKLVVFAAVLALATAQSSPIIPGAETLSTGFDMVAGVQNNSFTGTGLLPVFELHYTKGNTWTDPSDPSLEWSVPDELELHNLDRSYEVIDEALCTTYSDYISLVKENFDVSVGVTIGNGTAAMSANAKFNHESANYKQQMSSKLTAGGFSRHYWALYSLESLPPMLMTIASGFSAMIDKLPSSISTPQDQSVYNTLVSYWGTHFSWKADFGGRVHLSTFVDKTVLQTHSQSWVENQLSLTFHMDLFNLSGGGFKNQSQIHIDQAFSSASNTTLSFRGGDLTLQSNTTVNQWVKSIPANPVYLNNTIQDLSQIVRTVDTTKADLLQGVLKSYIATGKLPATDGSITNYDMFYDQYRDVPMYSPTLRGGLIALDRN